MGHWTAARCPTYVQGMGDERGRRAAHEPGAGRAAARRPVGRGRHQLQLTGTRHAEAVYKPQWWAGHWTKRARRPRKAGRRRRLRGARARTRELRCGPRTWSRQRRRCRGGGAGRFVKAYRALWRFRPARPSSPGCCGSSPTKPATAAAPPDVARRSRCAPPGKPLGGGGPLPRGSPPRRRAARGAASPPSGAFRSRPRDDRLRYSSTSPRPRRRRRSGSARHRQVARSRALERCGPSWRRGTGRMTEHELRPSQPSRLPAGHDLAPAVRAPPRGGAGAAGGSSSSSPPGRRDRRPPLLSAGPLARSSASSTSGRDDRGGRRAAAGAPADHARPRRPHPIPPTSSASPAFRPLASSSARLVQTRSTWDGGLLWYRYGRVRLLVSQGKGKSAATS